METIRLIPDGPRSGRFNMAADEALLRMAETEPFLGLRLYRWEPPAVSIGYMQDPERDLDLDALRRDGVEWVRRPTGGRAVLHKDDLTYCFVFPRSFFGLGKTVGATYRVLSECLARGLEILGVPCESNNTPLDTASARRETRLPCFVAPNRDELLAGGRKVSGSAQKRTDRAVLQHGSIPLNGAFRDLPRYIRTHGEERERMAMLLERKCTCLAESGANAGFSKAAAALVRGFSEILGLPCRERPWSPEELAQIALFEKSAADPS